MDKEAANNRSYTEGAGSSCDISLDSSGAKEQVFKMEKGQKLVFDITRMDGTICIKLTDSGNLTAAIE